jgi:protoheme IX farnesyltransferase
MSAEPRAQVDVTLQSPATALPRGGVIAARIAAYASLTKPRIVMLVVLTALLGYMTGMKGAPIAAGHLALALLGTALVAGGANSLNMCFEREQDALMRRTRHRALPAGLLRPNRALVFSAACGVAGVSLLAIGVNALTALLGIFAIASYAFVYTPLKRRTHLSLLIGAVPGALPPVMGWTAARGALGPEAAALFAILFFWQIPHFLAIAWIYRDDYARGGFPMLPVIEPEGERTARQTITGTIGLLLASMAPVSLQFAGTAYFIGAAALGILFFATALAFALHREPRFARALFLGSIVYLPALLGLLALGVVRS